MAEQNEGVARHAARAIRSVVFGLALLSLAACVERIRAHGYVPDEEQLSQITVGVDTRDTVSDVLGAPSTSGLIGNFGQANYSAAKMGIVGLSKSLALDMARFNVRSNCIAPFAWSRLIGTIPAKTEAEKARVERIKEMTPAKIAPLCVALADPTCDTTGQIFGVRNNEIFLFSQPRPIRSTHRSEGWTPETVRDHALPAMKGSFFDLERSGDIFTWDPI